jgi:MFS family permease
MDLDLNMKGYDYNVVISFFYISYILFEIPATMLCKYMGPGWFIPLTTILFGAASLATAWVNTVPQASGVRFVLGIFEAGMMPGIAYYLSRWYTRAELAFRISLYIVMAPLAGAFGGLLASAILGLDSFGNLHAWRMIFAIEGIVTVALGAIGLIFLTDRPETARWLTAEEKILAVERVKIERVGTTEMLDKIDTTKIMKGIFNPIVLGTSFLFLLNNVTVQGLAFFLPTIVKTIYKDASVIRLQLHTVPPYIVGAFFTVLFPLLSWRFDKRHIFFLICAPITMIGYIMFLASEVAMVRYAATFLVALSTFPFGPLCNGQSSANVVSDTARGAAIGTTVMLGNIGGLVSGWSFLPWDGPNYPIGNGLNLATSATVVVVALGMGMWARMDNKKRRSRDSAEELEGLTQQQIENLDWKHPDFLWRL